MASSISASVVAFIAAVAVTVLLHPLDLIKTRLQVGRISQDVPFLHLSSFTACRSIIAQEGWRGLYKGVVSSIIATGVSWGFFRYLYETLLHCFHDTNSHLMAYISFRFNHTKTPSKSLSSYNVSCNMAAALLAGAISTCFVHPLWLIKTRLEMQSLETKAAHWVQYKGWLHTLRLIYTQEGLQGLYKGLVPALGLVPQAGLQFVVYEELKRHTLNDGKNGSSQSVVGLVLGSANPTLAPFMWGAISKFVAVTATYPLQVIRTRLQIAPKMLPGTSKIVYASLPRHMLWRALFSGYTAHLQRACLYSGLHFLFFEYILTLK